MKDLGAIQGPTGTASKRSLRTMIGRDDMEPIGLLVFNLVKVGKDIEHIVGGEPARVVAKDKFEDVLTLDADVTYSAPGETLDHGVTESNFPSARIWKERALRYS